MPVGTGRRLNAGDLRERIQLLAPTRANDRGFGTVTYALAFTVWAAAQLGGGVNETTQERRAAKIDVDFDVRYRADITSDMRVVWDGRTYEITALLPEPGLGRMLLRCLEESAP